MFDINNSRDFYEKLLADFDDFMARQDSGRLALNCAITAYHMADWIWADWLKFDAATKTTLNIKSKDDFLAFIDRSFPWFPTVQALANGTKHFGRKEDFDAVKVRGYGIGPYGGGPHGQSYLTIDYGEAVDALPARGGFELEQHTGPHPNPHRFMPVALMLEGTVRLWRDFLNAHSPYKGNLPTGITALMEIPRGSS